MVLTLLKFNWLLTPRVRPTYYFIAGKPYVLYVFITISQTCCISLPAKSTVMVHYDM